MKKITSLIIFALILALLSGCSIGLSNLGNGTSTPEFFTPTLQNTFTPQPSSTLIPSSPTPTIEAIKGTATTKLNVRSTPTLDGEILGTVELNDSVGVIGKDKDGVWYLINFSNAPQGSGWVAAAFVEINQNADKIPVIGSSNEPTSTPLAADAARLLAQVNVRSGPGTNFDSLGVLDADTIVTVTGKNDTGTWIQIKFPNGPSERGWLSAGFIQVGDTSKLTVFNDFGTPVIVETGTAAPSATATVIAAAKDEDSQQAPIANLQFSPGGSGLYTFSSDVSSPRGDVEDWIGFTAYQTGKLYFSLNCQGNGNVQVELWQGNNVSQPWGVLTCGAHDQLIEVSTGQLYELHIQAIASDTLKYVYYQLTVRQ